MGIPTSTGRFAVKEQASGWGTAETSFANANFLEAQIVIPTPAQDSVQAEVMRASYFATTRVVAKKLARMTSAWTDDCAGVGTMI